MVADGDAAGTPRILRLGRTQLAAELGLLSVRGTAAAKPAERARIKVVTSQWTLPKPR